MQYRIHIDIPVGMDQESAIRIANAVIRDISVGFEGGDSGIKQFNVRLGNDDDRQRSNYLDINENGHCSTKKTIVNVF